MTKAIATRQAQAGDQEFEKFRCLKVRVRAVAGDGQLGVDGEHSAKFGARLVEPVEMDIGGDFGPHRCDQTRLLVQSRVGPIDRLFEASRREMTETNNMSAEKGIPIERAQTGSHYRT
jgi:hypothetical protein